ncbi:hypothetical protein QLL95_gp0779 [Cotonvirus japonicus]|uniref:Uncharacterized protein n=1 Tax=Cotonvirus japonicus TaxID=2811091 RepID=A0ABM7NT39_9VIRU|nr:hypothetical protein QLL95_gp0779 [Cotonvirus japonicus]BCS83344.1 hypothetical protein [Cotonvirus japonicus]
MSEDMYCGIGNIPKGKIRGTPEYCVQSNQVRYYGLEKIDKNLLVTAKGKTTNLVKEQLKLRGIEDEAKFLLKQIENIRVILDDEGAKESSRNQARKKKESLLVKRDKLVKKLKDQKKIVDAIEKKQEQEKKLNKKSSSGSKTSKSSKSSKSSSGSKTSKSSGSKSSSKSSSGSKTKKKFKGGFW